MAETKVAGTVVVQSQRLAELEEAIGRGLETFVEVGQALREIRDAGLYKDDYPTFKDYCQQRWMISRPRAYELMNSAQVVSAMADTGAAEVPANERQARALAPLKEQPEEMTAAWEEAGADGSPTAAKVKEAVEKRTEPAPPRRSAGGSTWEIRQGDALQRLREMPDESVQCCVTSPPYWGLRDYGIPPSLWPAVTYTLPGGEVEVAAMECCLGLESTPEQYVGHLVSVMREVLRVLRKDGTLWLNLGDTYNNRSVVRPSSHQAGLGFKSEHLSKQWSEHAAEGATRMTIADGLLKEKDLLGIPWLVAFALRADGWYLRAENIWHKESSKPESVTDRTTRAHEHFFHLTKSARYFYEEVPGFKRSVWPVATRSYPGAHFATFPPELVEPCILAGAREGDVVLDPFCGAATTGLVATRHSRDFIGIERNQEYVELGLARIEGGING